MDHRKIERIISALYVKSAISSLEKDILDTYNELHKVPFDQGSARLQILSNNMHHPDIFIAIQASPDVIQKPFTAVTQEDMIFNLNRQLEGLIAKEMEAQSNGKKEN